MAAVLLLVFPGCNENKTASAEVNSNHISQDPAESSIMVLGAQATKELLAKQPEIVIIDVRTPQEYNAGHLQHAKLIDFNAADFDAQISQLDPTKPHLVYCAVGGRSKKAAEIMKNNGFRLVYNVNQGFVDLKEAGVATE